MENPSFEIDKYADDQVHLLISGKFVPEAISQTFALGILLFGCTIFKDFLIFMRSITAVLILSSLVGILHGIQSEEGLVNENAKWSKLALAAVYVEEFCWGAIFFNGICFYPFIDLSVVIVTLIAIGKTAITAASLAVTPGLARSQSIISMAPMIASLFFQRSTDSFLVAGLACVNLVYQWSQISILARAFRQDKERVFRLPHFQKASYG